MNVKLENMDTEIREMDVPNSSLWCLIAASLPLPLVERYDNTVLHWRYCGLIMLYDQRKHYITHII